MHPCHLLLFVARPSILVEGHTGSVKTNLRRGSCAPDRRKGSPLLTETLWVQARPHLSPSALFSCLWGGERQNQGQSCRPQGCTLSQLCGVCNSLGLIKHCFHRAKLLLTIFSYPPTGKKNCSFAFQVEKSYFYGMHMHSGGTSQRSPRLTNQAAIFFSPQEVQ